MPLYACERSLFTFFASLDFVDDFLEAGFALAEAVFLVTTAVFFVVVGFVVGAFPAAFLTTFG